MFHAILGKMMAAHRRIILPALIGLALQGFSLSQPSPEFLLEGKELALLESELSGEQAKAYVTAISGYHRLVGTPGYVEAARYVLEKLHNSGFRASIESFPADGRISYQSWQSPPGWNVESAELRVVRPKKSLVVSYPDSPMSLIPYSKTTEIQEALVDVGTGLLDRDYEGKGVGGKLVLATGDPGPVHRIAVLKYGAAGVVSFPDDPIAREKADMFRFREWRPRSEELDRVTFGFNLTNAQGQSLRDQLNKKVGVVLGVKIVGRGVEFGSLDVVTATIPGSENIQQELLFIAHLDNAAPSANQSASGSAALLDIARALKALIDTGKLPVPKRTLRFVWVPRLIGTMAYIEAHPELRGPTLGGRVLGGINLDAVGSNLELLNTTLNISEPPRSLSSVLPDVIERVASYVDKKDGRVASQESRFNYRMVPFGGRSDHLIFNDGTIGIPVVNMTQWPDETRNTSQDEPQNIDAVELERVELISTAAIWYLANLTEEQSLTLTNRVAAGAQKRMASDTHKASELVLQAPVNRLDEMYNEGKRILALSLEREQKTLEDILYVAPGDLTRRMVQTWNQTLDNQSQIIIRTLQGLLRQRGGNLSFSQRMTTEAREASAWIPSRLTRGPLADGLPQSMLTEAEKTWYETPEARSLDTYLLVSLIDGRRTILDIRNDLSALTRSVSIAAVTRFVQDLVKSRLVELQRR
jgi:hypothetical protein